MTETKPVIDKIMPDGQKNLSEERQNVTEERQSVPEERQSVTEERQSVTESFETGKCLRVELTFEVAMQRFKKSKMDLNQNEMKKNGIMGADGYFTNMGLLLSDQCEHTIKVAIFDGTNKILLKDRREFKGCLLKQLTAAFEFIHANNKNGPCFDGLRSVDKRDFPPEAIREALINSILHRNYSYSGCTLINVYVDKMEFVSIGGLVKGLTIADILLGVSQTRNEKLAACFYVLKIVDAFGSGIKNIMDIYEESIRKPEIKTTENAFMVILPNLNYSRPTTISHSHEYLVLDHINTYSYITRRKAQKLLEVGQTMAGRILKEMGEAGLLKMVGKGPNTSYIKKN